ncbi:MAG TPA: hypothetical protein VFX06_18145 [Stellaceae bacterium]|nr:hypothetical protein [Stellaceae bacterium]
MKHIFTAASALAMLVVTATAGAQPPAQGPGANAGRFSLASLRGNYAMEFSGQFMRSGGWFPVMGTGVIVSDGRGNLGGAETYSTETKTCDATLTGTYTVEPDGSGTVSLTFSGTTPGCAGGSFTQSLAIAGDGELVLLSNTNPGDLIKEKWYLQKR